MKKIHYILLAMTAAIGCASCNNEWEDEQFDQMVSFKATLNDDGVSPLYVRYDTDGLRTYELPVFLSGSTMSTQSRTVHVAVDTDTLDALNQERYGRREGLYYQLLDEQYYSFPETVEIPKGSWQTVLPIDFTLGGTNNQNPLDLSDKWILPLTIADDESYDYISNPRKHYRKALLNITPFNDYSGSYSATSCLVYLAGNSEAFTRSETRAYVVDDKTIFIYAGLRDMEYLDRAQYKVFIRFTDELAGIDTQKYKLEVWSDGGEDNPTTPEVDEGSNFEVLGNCYYETSEDYDVTRPYLKHEYITIYLNYSFEDYTTSPGQRLAYTVDGTLSMQRDLNTLIPDEDQQIQW